MSNVAELEEEVEEIETLHFISTALTEVSAIKIQGIRKDFETNQEFYKEVGEVYDIVKLSAAIEKQKEEEEKIISVAITSNMRFYGNLNQETMKKFIEETTHINTDRMVIGQTGIDYLKTSGYPHAFEKLLFKKDAPTREEIIEFLAKVKNYNRIFVFFPKFETLVRQSVGVIDITHSPSKGTVKQEKMIKHVFEPQLSKLLEFFERQVRTVLFTRAMLEADLARTAARLMSMSAAQSRAQEDLKEKKAALSLARRAEQNRQLLESFAGMVVWRKE